MAELTDTFLATGPGKPWSASKESREGEVMGICVNGFGLGQIDLEWSFDGGSTWHKIDEYTANDARVYDNPSEDILYRFNCVAFVSGDIKTWLAL